MDIVGIIVDLFEWIVFFVLLAVGFFVGRLLEKGHYESIRHDQINGTMEHRDRWDPNWPHDRAHWW